jgi:hypothetical protein
MLMHRTWNAGLLSIELAATGWIRLAVSARAARDGRRDANGKVRRPSPSHAASVSGSITSALRTEQTAHPVPPGRVSARQRYLEPVSGFEPLTVRLQGQSP